MLQKKLIKITKIYCIFFLAIVCLLFCSMLIPHKLVEKKSIDSIQYVHQYLLESKTNSMYPMFLETDDGDLRYSEMVYFIDSKHPIKSMIEMNSYMSGNLETFQNVESHEYARYWHGPILYLRLFMLKYDISEIYALQLIALIVMTVIFVVCLLRFDTALGISSSISLVMFSVFSVYHNISYFNCLMISMTGSLLLLYFYHKKKMEYTKLLFALLGLFTCFFDFYTIDALTLTLPLLVYSFIQIKSNQSFATKEYFKIIILWFLGYMIPFFMKWIIDYFYFGEDVIIDILTRMQNEGNAPKTAIPLLSILNQNLKLIFPFYYMKHYEYALIPLLLISLLVGLFYMKWKKHGELLFVVIICLLRLLCVPIQSVFLPFSTFRNLIPIFIIVFYIITRQIILLFESFKKK